MREFKASLDVAEQGIRALSGASAATMIDDLRRTIHSRLFTGTRGSGTVVRRIQRSRWALCRRGRWRHLRWALSQKKNIESARDFGRYEMCSHIMSMLHSRTQNLKDMCADICKFSAKDYAQRFVLGERSIYDGSHWVHSRIDQSSSLRELAKIEIWQLAVLSRSALQAVYLIRTKYPRVLAF